MKGTPRLLLSHGSHMRKFGLVVSNFVVIKISLSINSTSAFILKQIKTIHSLQNYINILYNTLIVPHIRYGINLWGHHYSGRNLLWQLASYRLVFSKLTQNKFLNLLNLKQLHYFELLKLFQDMHNRPPVVIVNLLHNGQKL